MNFVFMVLLTLLILMLFKIYIKSLSNIYYVIPLLFTLICNELYNNKYNIII
jgi:hypothetical protein